MNCGHSHPGLQSLAAADLALSRAGSMQPRGSRAEAAKKANRCHTCVASSDSCSTVHPGLKPANSFAGEKSGSEPALRCPCNRGGPGWVHDTRVMLARRSTLLARQRPQRLSDSWYLLLSRQREALARLIVRAIQRSPRLAQWNRPAPATRATAAEAVAATTLKYERGGGHVKVRSGRRLCAPGPRPETPAFCIRRDSCVAPAFPSRSPAQRQSISSSLKD